MSSHADTIRSIVNQAYYSGFTEKERDESLAALDALLAENQRLREALERIRDETTHYLPGDHICPACMAEVTLAGDEE